MTDNLLIRRYKYHERTKKLKLQEDYNLTDDASKVFAKANLHQNTNIGGAS